MQRKPILSRRWARGTAVVAATALSIALAMPAGADPLQGVESAAVNSEKSYVVDVQYANGIKGKITFLEDDIFRLNVDPSGKFSVYAAPRAEAHVGRIPAQPDSSSKYKHAKPEVKTEGNSIVITAGKTTISLDKATAKMTVKSGDKVLVEETSALDLAQGGTVQTLAKTEGEHFFGGGTQNGRIDHTGKVITLDKGGWEDGQVASPSPFYWSTKGYGVLRNTFQNGAYDFGKTDGGTVSTSQEENEFDAYFFLSDDEGNASVARDLLGDYFQVTGNPVLLPEYGFYLGHLNAYNRDGWSKDAKNGGKKWDTKGSKPGAGSEAEYTRYEHGMKAEYVVPGDLSAESLNGEGPTVATENMKTKKFDREFSARQVIDDYQNADMPLGWFLPNDGYGAGYGQNGFDKTGDVKSDGTSGEQRQAAIDANVDNLRKFTEYANGHGVATGLWTQSYLTPDSNPNTKWHLLRDFGKEVETGGISTLKTDVAWVGAGYSMALDGTVSAYNTATTRGDVRPNLVTLCGWAGTQRTGAIWSGDQYGGNWEYIRFHIPTFVGQSLSGNPNAGSDMDGIFGGNPVIATRDYQWKTFTTTMLDMDGWGSYRKTPMTHGDPYTGISRMYLKLKAQLMPYLYTSAASAANIDTKNGDTGLPMMRAMFLTDSSDYALSGAENLNYQYTFGNNLLVAPVYENTKGEGIGDGNDVRNGIYLPNYGTEQEPTIWVDYFTGKQYRGGQVLNNFDAPLWKLPLFVKAGTILPMYEEHNNPQAISKDNPEGLDKTKRVVEFWPAGSSEYTLFEDDGKTVSNDLKDGADGYGKEANISYGGHVSTHMSSKVEGNKATLTIDASEGTYTGYNANRVTTMVVNVSKEPTAIKAGAQSLNKVNDKAALDKLSDTQSGWCYVEEPNLNAGAVDHPEEKEFAKIEMKTTPKVYIKLARTDVSKNAQSVVVEGFENKGEMGKDTLNSQLGVPANLDAPQDQKTPTSIALTWAPVDNATSYEVKIDGTVNAVGDVQAFTHKGLAYKSKHTYQVRARNAEGYSEWSKPLETESLEDPWRNVPQATTTWTGDYYANQTEAIAFDHDLGANHFHSSSGAVSGKHALTVDFGLIYKLDQLEYFPRNDYGNGTVKKMKIETSLDGNNWTEFQTTNWNWGNKQGSESVAFGDAAARYVRLTAVEAVGDFFSAREIKITKDDGTDGFAVGSTGFKPTITDADLQNIEQYKGLENRGEDKSSFDAQVAARFCDLNNNGVYDVYDYAFALSKYNGGTKQEGAVSGSCIIVPNKTSAKSGETVTYTLYANNVKNANALGALFNFKSSDFDYVAESLKGTSYVGAMEDLSIAKTGFADGKQTINIAFVNKGDMPLFDGSAAIASFQLTAKRDLDASAIAEPTTVTPYTSILMGPACDVVEYTYDGTVDVPAKPESTTGEYAQSDFASITMTNDVLTTDDGSNAGKLLQNTNGFAPLFDGDESNGSFEFKWDIKGNHTQDGFLPGYVKLPTDMTFTFKTPSPLDNVAILNRTSSNGSVTSLRAVINFEGGDKQEFSFDRHQDVFVLTVDEAHKAKKATSVVITPLTSVGNAGANPDEPNKANRMLTLREINFNYAKPGVTASDIELGENKTELYVDDLTEVKAKVLPFDERYPFYTVSVKDPQVASATEVQNADGGTSWFLRANKPGETEVTVASLANPEVKKAYKIKVHEGVDATELEQAISQASGLHESAYTPDTYKALQAAKADAQKLLESGSYTKDQIHAAAVKIQKAIDGLKMRELDFDTHFNKDAASGVTVVKASSSAGESPYANALDYDEKTFWHSNYNDADVLPDYVIYDLGAEHELTDVAFKTRQDGGTNGDIFEAQVYVADTAEALDGDGQGTLLGTFKFGNNGKVLNNRNDWQQMTFGPTKTRFVKLEATRAGGDQKDAYASIAETRFYEKQDKKLANVEALTTLVNGYKAENLKAENYTEATWTPFANLMADAEALIANPPAAADQARVDELAKSLEAARKGLIEKAPEPEKPNKDELNALIEKAKKAETEGKTQVVVDEFNAALKNAVEVSGNEGATEAQVKDAYTRLNEALAKLNADDGSSKPVDPNKPVVPGQPGGNAGSGAAGQTGSKPGSGDKLAQTGDPAVMAVAAAGGLGGLFAALGAKLRRRKRD